jgi:predicted neutral ceramidase superfamily lipid hydrolase
MNLRNQGTVTLLLLSVSALSAAQSPLSGPIMITMMGFYKPEWLLAVLAMSVCVDAAIYRYTKLFKRPFLASLCSNTVVFIASPLLIFDRSRLMKNAFFEQAGRRAMDGAQNPTRKCLIFGGRS